MEADIALQDDDDTILLIVGDEGQIIKEEIVDNNSNSEYQDSPEGMVIIKEEILDVTLENSDGVEYEEIEELMPVTKYEPLDEDYVSLRKSWEEKQKMVEPGERKSFVKELKKKHPELAKNRTKLVCALVKIMKSVQVPPLPQDYYVMNGILFECIICAGLTETIPAAGRHYQEKHGPRYMFCYACGVNYRSRSSLYIHEKRCLASDRDVVLRARAVFLGNKGKTRPYLELAKKLKMNIPSSKDSREKLQKINIPSSKDSREKLQKINQFECQSCPATFTSKQALKSHTHLHLGLRPHRCTECDYAYTSSGALSAHVKREHCNVQFICDDCGRAFKAKNGLAIHVETHRPKDQRRYECVECGRRFAQKITMKRHVERKHLRAPPPCACNLCPERFRRTTLLKEHMRKVHGVTLMTQKMFYKALPTMTDEEVKEAMGYKFDAPLPTSTTRTSDIKEEFSS